MIEVSNMTEHDILGAVHAIQEAFADDPYAHWVFDPKKFDKKRNVSSLTLRCQWGMRNALFMVAKDPASSEPDKVLGIAMWLLPRRLDQPETWEEWFEGWRFWFGQLYVNVSHLGRGGLNTKRYYIWKDAQAKCQAEVFTGTESPYFCNIVTVLPEAQGKGIGKLLFQAVFDKADREGRQCYLESSPARDNAKIYGKLGFKMVKQMDCDDDGTICAIKCMIREPQTLASS